MKKRVSLVIVLSLILALFATYNVAAETVSLTSSVPYIKADVGQTIDLSSVKFDGKTATVYDGETPISSYKPTIVGCKVLTAKYDGGQSSVYLLSKQASDTAYVIYSAVYSEYTALAQLKDEGYTFNSADGTYLLSDKGLTIGNNSNGYARMILPMWIADIADYKIDATFQMVTSTDTARWCSIVYRGQTTGGKAGDYYPYMHMCMRENTTATNGVEYAERTKSNAWNVINTASFTTKSLKNAMQTATVECYGQTVKYSIDGSEVYYRQDMDATYSKGYVGFTVNYSSVILKSIKVTLLDTAPTHESAALKLVDTAYDETNILNPLTNVEELDSINDVDKLIASDYHPANAIIDVKDKGVSSEAIKSAIIKLSEAGIIPGFEVKTASEAQTVASALNASGKKDGFIVSESKDAVSAGRKANTLLRAGLMLDNIGKELTSAQLGTLRAQVRGSGASFCILDAEDATRNNVAELQELSVAVWIKADEDDAVECIAAITSGANGVICKDSKVMASYFTQFAANTVTRTPVIIAHRGASGQQLENSMAAYKAAYEHGADVIEIDILTTKDKQLVVMHDDTLNRTTNYTGAQTIANMTLAEIKQYKLNNGEEIPTFDDVLEYCSDKDLRIFVELKDYNTQTAKSAAEAVKKYCLEDKVCFISFAASQLTTIQSSLNGTATGALYNASGASNCNEDALNNLYPLMVSALGVNSSVNVNYGTVSKYFDKVATDRGITVWPWTFTAGNNQTAWDMFTDGLTTNNCEWFDNMYKSVSATDANVKSGESLTVKLNGFTYGKKTNSVNPTEIIVISGSDVISVNDGVITANKSGKAQIYCSYSTKTAANKAYVLYTQPITITVTTADDESKDAESKDVSAEPEESSKDTQSTEPAESAEASQSTDSSSAPSQPESSESHETSGGQFPIWIIIVIAAIVIIAVIVVIIVKKKQ